MKRTPWLKYLPVILASTWLAPVALTQAYPAAPVHIAQQGSDYGRYMRIGYAATAKRDYRTALINFRRALDVRAGDRYASNAIRNVSSYVDRGVRSEIAFIPRNDGAPFNRIGGSTRGACSSGEKPLTALVPAKDRGLTTAEYPVLLFYVPRIHPSVQTLEFALLDENDKQIGKTTVVPTRNPGIVSLSLSAVEGLPPLEIGKNYHWYFSIICNSQNRAADIFVDGWVQRIEVDPVLASELKTLAPGDRVSLYAVNNIWYDTLAALYEARRVSPLNSVLADEWADLLKSVGLDEMASNR